MYKEYRCKLYIGTRIVLEAVFDIKILLKLGASFRANKSQKKLECKIIFSIRITYSSYKVTV